MGINFFSLGDALHNNFITEEQLYYCINKILDLPDFNPMMAFFYSRQSGKVSDVYNTGFVDVSRVNPNSTNSLTWAPINYSRVIYDQMKEYISIQRDTHRIMMIGNKICLLKLTARDMAILELQRVLVKLRGNKQQEVDEMQRLFMFRYMENKLQFNLYNITIDIEPVSGSQYQYQMEITSQSKDRVKELFSKTQSMSMYFFERLKIRYYREYLENLTGSSELRAIINDTDIALSSQKIYKIINTVMNVWYNLPSIIGMEISTLMFFQPDLSSFQDTMKYIFTCFQTIYILDLISNMLAKYVNQYSAKSDTYYYPTDQLTGVLYNSQNLANNLRYRAAYLSTFLYYRIVIDIDKRNSDMLVVRLYKQKLAEYYKIFAQIDKLFLNYLVSSKMKFNGKYDEASFNRYTDLLANINSLTFQSKFVDDVAVKDNVRYQLESLKAQLVAKSGTATFDVYDKMEKLYINIRNEYNNNYKIKNDSSNDFDSTVSMIYKINLLNQELMKTNTTLPYFGNSGLFQIYATFNNTPKTDVNKLGEMFYQLGKDIGTKKFVKLYNDHIAPYLMKVQESVMKMVNDIYKKSNDGEKTMLACLPYPKEDFTLNPYEKLGKTEKRLGLINTVVPYRVVDDIIGAVPTGIVSKNILIFYDSFYYNDGKVPNMKNQDSYSMITLYQTMFSDRVPDFRNRQTSIKKLIKMMENQIYKEYLKAIILLNMRKRPDNFNNITGLTDLVKDTTLLRTFGDTTSDDNVKKLLGRKDGNPYAAGDSISDKFTNLQANDYQTRLNAAIRNPRELLKVAIGTDVFKYVNSSVDYYKIDKVSEQYNAGNMNIPLVDIFNGMDVSFIGDLLISTLPTISLNYDRIKPDIKAIVSELYRPLQNIEKYKTYESLKDIDNKSYSFIWLTYNELVSKMKMNKSSYTSFEKESAKYIFSKQLDEGLLASKFIIEPYSHYLDIKLLPDWEAWKSAYRREPIIRSIYYYPQMFNDSNLDIYIFLIKYIFID